MGLNQFLREECPPEGGCLLVEAIWNGKVRHFVCKRHTTADDRDMFTINDRLYYDYDFMWDENNPWKILWCHIKE